MSQFCGFCGCPLEDGCDICPNCGAQASGGDSFDAARFSDPTLESVSAEEFASVSDSVPEPEPDLIPEPTPEPKTEAKSSAASTGTPKTTTPKATSVPKLSDSDHITPVSPAKPSGTSSTSASTGHSTPIARPKKKRSCCGCGCCLPVLIALALSVFLVFSGIAGEIFTELGLDVDLSEIEALLGELMDDLPSAESRPSGNIPADAVELNGHYYYLYTEPVTSFEEAQAFCESNGGYLATITSAEENQFLYDYILSLDLMEYAYLGGTDSQDEGTWRWISGEPFAYTNWNSGEPNNDLDGEHEMAMHRLLEGGMWNDIAFQTPSVLPRYPEISGIEASSTLVGRHNYGPETMLDNDLNTAWNEGVDGITGESVTYYFDGSYPLTGLEIRGGFQYSEDIYYANARPREVRLDFSNGDWLILELEDIRDVQYLEFPSAVNAEWVTLTVNASYSGDTYDDLCITELQYHSGTTPVTGFLCEWGEPTPAE